MTPSALVRVSTRQLDAAFGDPKVRVSPTIYDASDGMQTLMGSSASNALVRGGDGRIWAAASEAILWVDPAQPNRNKIPPTVMIKAANAGRRSYRYGPIIVLPKGSDAVRIDYTATSLSVPGRVHFRYRLSGVDKDWVDAGSRRQAFYTNLRPGDYTFQVVASNDDGVWNNAGAKTRITISPSFWQTNVFILLCVVVVLALLWSAYVLRTRALTARVHDRLETQVAERERIARELHDTLLQGMQGLIFKIHAIAKRLSTEQPERPQMEKALDEADGVLGEARVRVGSLRSERGSEALPNALAAAAERTLPAGSIKARIVVQGTTRPLDPIVFEEVERIGQEALLNIVRHARAGGVEIGIEYTAATLTVSWTDDGRGIEHDVLADGRRDGHYGLTGMRERAAEIGGDLQIVSGSGAGTRVSISVPGRRAYLHPRRSLWPAIRGLASSWGKIRQPAG